MGDQVTARQDQGVVQTNSSTGFFTLTGPCLFGNYIASSIFVDTYNVSAASFSNGPNSAARDAVHGLVGEAGYSNIISGTQAEANRNAVTGTTIYTISRQVTLLHSTGQIEVRNYSFTASSSDTSLPDSIPVPPDGEWIMALLPTVAFAP